MEIYLYREKKHRVLRPELLNRIEECWFKYKASKTNPYNEEWKIMKVKAKEFSRRYLQHVLPYGFMKVRYYGLFASANKKFSYAREVLGCKNLEAKKAKKHSNAKITKEIIAVYIMPKYVFLNNKTPPK